MELQQQRQNCCCDAICECFSMCLCHHCYQCWVFSMFLTLVSPSSFPSLLYFIFSFVIIISFFLFYFFSVVVFLSFFSRRFLLLLLLYNALKMSKDLCCDGSTVLLLQFSHSTNVSVAAAHPYTIYVYTFLF